MKEVNNMTSLSVGDMLIVKAWGKFAEMRMTCVSVSVDEKFNATQYAFDNGMKFFDIELLANFDLWKARNGFEIIAK